MAKYIIELGDEANRHLDEVAKEKGMTKAGVISRAVATYVTVNRYAHEGQSLAALYNDDSIIVEHVELDNAPLVATSEDKEFVRMVYRNLDAIVSLLPCSAIGREDTIASPVNAMAVLEQVWEAQSDVNNDAHA